MHREEASIGASDGQEPVRFLLHWNHMYDGAIRMKLRLYLITPTIFTQSIAIPTRVKIMILPASRHRSD